MLPEKAIAYHQDGNKFMLSRADQRDAAKAISKINPLILPTSYPGEDNTIVWTAKCGKTDDLIQVLKDAGVARD